MSKLERYCLGFCFTEDLNQVVLLKKSGECKIPILRNTWNGVGGKVFDREDTSEAMDREWVEETETATPSWVRLGSLWVTDNLVVAVFGSITKTIRLDSLKKIGKEPCQLTPIFMAGNADYPLAPHVDWMLPMVNRQMIRVYQGKTAGQWRLNEEYYGRL